MGTILKVKSNGAFISIPAIIGPQGPQGIQGPQGDPGNVSDVTVNGTSVVTSGVAAINLVDYVYPIGSIYLSINSTNPGSLIGGTWVAWGTGRVPVGVDTSDTSFDTVEETGGSKYLTAHTHSFSATSGDQSQSHQHYVTGTSGSNSANHTHWVEGTTGNDNTDHTHWYDTGSGGAHSHNTKTLKSTGSNSGSMAESYGSWGSTRNITIPYGSTNGTHSHAGWTGGRSAFHQHTFEATSGTQSANHTHSIGIWSWTQNQGHTHSVSGTTGSTGSGNAENLQPYITCYMWKRTA